MSIFNTVIAFLILVQTIPFVLTKEKIVKNEYPKYSVTHSTDQGLDLIKRITPRKNEYEAIEISSEKTINILPKVTFSAPFLVSDINGAGYLNMMKYTDNKWFYSVQYSDDNTYEIYYQKLWLQYKGKDYLLDSIYNADKKIHSSFSNDGRYLLVNTLNTLSDYYNPELDNRIMVYDLKDIDKGEIKKEYLPCTHCSDSYLVGDKLFFTIGRKDAYDGFSNKDIYVAPWGSLQDSVKIASNTDIKAISFDGKYILGTRFWDRQKNTSVLLNVEEKKYQMLLGRDYAKHNAFYSDHEDKFSFDFKGYLIYVDFPESYPFDALKWRNEEIPDWTDEEFWKKYEHSPLNEN